jgi:hypothetical protein
MGFIAGDIPPVDPDTFLDRPLLERIKILALHWVEHGGGAPKVVHVFYLSKILLLNVLGGTLLALWTSGLGPIWDVASWWNQPVVYQKLVLWVIFIEAVGFGGSWGPLCGRYKPMLGGIRYWTKPGTIRLRPWRRVPFTNGDRRTWFDVAIYLGFIGSLLTAIVLPGAPSASLLAALPDNTSGLVRPEVLIAPIVLYVLNGLRDKTIFLSARGEQYLPALVFFAVLPFVDMIIAAKLLICLGWVCVGFSKLGRHFPNVIPVMISNSPAIPAKWIKRLHYRDFPRDILPSKIALLVAHVAGTAVEILTPFVLLFSTNRTATIAAVILMLGFHTFITSTFPLGAPLEWNILFAYLTVFLFLGFPSWEGYAITDMSTPWLTVGIAVALLFFPILGNLRPDLVSFLPSARQYAGNWAAGLWVFAPGAEEKLNSIPHTPAKNHTDQLVASGYPLPVAEVMLHAAIAFRAMHSQGRGLFSVLLNHFPDLDQRRVREAEFLCNSLIGFSFGDGHLHNEDLINAVQSRVGFAPGELTVVWAESQPVHKDFQRYKLIDAALGVIEEGTWKVADAVREQPWLPNGPIPLNVFSTRARSKSVPGEPDSQKVPR